jgi:hypothetical protein
MEYNFCDIPGSNGPPNPVYGLYGIEEAPPLVLAKEEDDVVPNPPLKSAGVCAVDDVLGAGIISSNCSEVRPLELPACSFFPRMPNKSLNPMFKSACVLITLFLLIRSPSNQQKQHSFK